MGPFGSFLFVYILGGLTFIPLVLSLILLHAYLTLPSSSSSPQAHEEAQDAIRRADDDQYSLKSGTDELAEKFQRTHESDVAAGYFAVCREYVPGGVNGKPPERTTPAGEVIAAESPSVYQAMYRSLFDRKQAPSIEPAKTNGKNAKRARNVFYMVLRHGHLMLYDDANQVEVRYVISLAHHDVSIYSGEGEIPEGELWIKRNAICLSRRLDSLADLGGPTPPFYLFSENLSEKEDFYFAMLQNQAKMGSSADRPPVPQQFEVKDIVTLVQRLHSSEDQLQTRWINAVFGRLFLALYKTPEIEEFIRKKITKKISRVNKPNFISKLGLQRIDMGEGTPFITNPRLKDLTVDGNCCIETDIQYTGNFRVEISATVRIDLGPRFKAREVDIVLAVVLKKLEGHLLLRFKPPPSNRFWISFETMPNMVMDIQPIVSSKQITYGIILRTIESRIREVVAESIVLPFWDDVPFMDTYSQLFRGGIWQREIPKPPDSKAEIPDESEGQAQTTRETKEDSIQILKAKDDRTMSLPVLPDTTSPILKSRKGSRSSISEFQGNWSTSSSAIEKLSSATVPRAMRSQTFSNAADPVLTADTVKVDKVVYDGKTEEKSSATSAMIKISSQSPPSSPKRTAGNSPPNTDGLVNISTTLTHSCDSSIAESIESPGEVSISTSPQRPTSAHTVGNSIGLEGAPSRSSASLASDKSRRRSTLDTLTRSITSSASSEDKPQGTLSIGTAAAVAKKWGWNMFNKGEQNTAQEASRPAGTPEQPIGRGHPLPPPGTPLPPPEKVGYRRNTMVPKRKPVPPPPLPERPKTEHKRPVPKPPLPKRKPISSSEESDDRPDEVLIVEAPYDSAPNSPAADIDTDIDTSNHLSAKSSHPLNDSQASIAPRWEDGHSDEGDKSSEAAAANLTQEGLEVRADEVVR